MEPHRWVLEGVGRQGTGQKLLPLPYPEMDSRDAVVTDSSVGLLSSLLVGGGWDMLDAGAGGKGVEDSGAAVGEASGGAGVPWPALACDNKKKKRSGSSISIKPQHPAASQPHPAYS